MPEGGEKMSEYPDFTETTGYGKVDGLCGANCRHSFRPFYPGATTPRWSPEELQKYKEKTYTYTAPDGTENTVDAYEASQIQRKLERYIRNAKRAIAVNEAAGQDTVKNKKDLTKYQGYLKKYLDDTGLRRQYFRERIAKK